MAQNRRGDVGVGRGLLDLSLVIRTGLAIADEEGIERLTMRRLATDLGVTPMAIYHHVPNKEVLLDLIADEALKALPDVDPNADWEREVVRLFTAFHHLHLLHPALAYVMTKRPLEGPTAIRLGDRVIGMIIAGGLTEQEALSAFIAFNNFTVGTSLYRIVRGGLRASDAPRFTGIAQETAPVAYRMRDLVAGSIVDDRQFVDGLTRLVRSFRP